MHQMDSRKTNSNLLQFFNEVYKRQNSGEPYLSLPFLFEDKVIMQNINTETKNRTKRYTRCTRL